METFVDHDPDYELITRAGRGVLDMTFFSYKEILQKTQFTLYVYITEETSIVKLKLFVLKLVTIREGEKNPIFIYVWENQKVKAVRKLLGNHSG